jgi:hypothetical protein
MSLRGSIFRVKRLVLGACCMIPLAVHAHSSTQWIESNAGHPRIGVQVKIDRFTAEEAARVKAAGFAFVRLGVWSNAMKNAAYRKQVASAFEVAHAVGLAVIVTVRSTASLVQPDVDQDVRARQLHAAALELVHVVRGIVGTYGQEVLAVELWNEPEWQKYWPTGDPDSTFPVYMHAVCEGLASIRESTRVIGFAFATPLAAGSKSDKLLQSVEATSPHCLDAVSWHAYGKSAREIRNVSDYVRTRYGVPAVITEWGVSSGRLSGESGQLADFRSFLAKLDALETPLISIYEWQDTANAQNTREQHFGLVDAAGEEKPVFNAVKPMLARP